MDFGYSDDQRDIQRTARDLLTERARPERVRELAEAGRSDDELWRELRPLGGAGIAVAEEDGGQGLGGIELSILCEELGRSLAPVPFLPSVMAAALVEHGGGAGARRRAGAARALALRPRERRDQGRARARRRPQRGARHRRGRRRRDRARRR